MPFSWFGEVETLHQRTFGIVLVATLTRAIALMPSLAEAERPSLTLDEALRLAHDRSPALKAARQLPGEARGALTTARLFLQDNPELEVAGGPRSASELESGTTDLELEVEQRLEVGGQRRHRIARADAGVSAAEASVEEARRSLDLAVADVFYEALAAREQTRLLAEGKRLAASLETIAMRRLEAGEGTALELNTARIRRAEATRRLTAAKGASTAIGIRLAELIGLSPAQAPEPVGSLPAESSLASESELLARGLETRPDLRAAEMNAAAAQAAVALADAEAVPDLGLAISAAREEGQDVLLAGVRISLPFINRNQGRREETRAALLRREAQVAQKRLAVEADLRRAWHIYEAALAAHQLYDAEIINAQAESLALLEQAFGAGEVGYAEVVVVQREVLDGRLGRLDAELALAQATARLLAAAHLPQTSSAPETTDD